MVYTDYSSGKIWALNFQNGARENELVHDWDGGFTGYENSHDEQEIYMTNYNKGKIYKLANSSQVNPEPPTLLSQTGAFTDLETLTPAAGLIPYAPAAPLWSDRAVKRRWVAIPNDGTHNTLTEKIVFSEEGEWDFPEGSVFIKHFEMPSKADPSKVVRLETRFLVRGYDGYYGFTYKWNLAGTDAVLQTGGSSEVIPVEQADGSPGAQDWNYPSRSQCMECHQSAAGRVLGLKTRQVNWDFNYQAAGTQNQLSYLDSLNIFHVALNSSNFGSYTTSKGIKDTSATEQHRIRSYLDSNCSNCHRPGGVAGRAQFDARLTTPFALAGIVGAAPSAETLGLTDPQLVKPGDYQNSLIYHRDSVRGEDAQMPPLGTNITDPDYLALLENWISQLSPDDVDSGAARGLNGSYYSGLNFQQLVMERVDPVVDFNWGGGAPSTQMPTNDFSVRWTGYIKIPETGTYTFYTTTDDGVRLWLDGMQVINDWTNHPAKEFSGSLVLLKDQIVPVTMEYFESGGEAVAKLEWSGPGISRTVIPNEQLQTELTDSQDPDPDPDPNPNPDPDPDPDPQPDPDLPPLAGPSEGVPAYNGSWQLLPSADGTKPVERHEGDYLAISNKLYLLGGRGTKPVQTYDASTNTWTNQSAAPFQIHHFQAVEWGGKIYIVGAFTGNYPDEDPVPNVYIYDPANDTWTQGPEIPVDRRRGATAAVVYNDKIYVIAGNTKGHQNGWVSWFDEFDPATGQWTSLPDAPRPRDHHRAVLFEDKLYVVAGRRSNDPIQNVKANTIVEIDVYDFATGEWSTLSRPLPTERAGAAVIKHGREILVLAGESLNGNHNEVEALDVINGTWRILPPLVQKRNAPGGASFQNRLFVTVGAPEPQSANQEFLDLDPLPFPDGGVPITGNTGTDPGDIGDQAGLLGAYYSGQNFATLKFERVDAGVNFSWGNNGPDAAQLTNDNFSIRWTGHVTIPATGSYTFYTQTDDGVRLWLDDELLIEDWESQPTSENSTTLFLQQDQVVSIKMEYFENGGGAVAKLLWSGPLFAKTAIPASYLSTVGPGGTPDPDPDPQPDPDPDPQPDPDPEPDPDPQPDPDPDPDPTPMDNGLLGTYFSTIDLSGTPVTRVDPVVDFNWGGGGPTNLTVTDNFSIRWTGFVTIPETGDYTFTTTTDDGVRLWLNDVLMINDWQSQPPTENPATLSLVQGQVVAIKMEYYEKGAGAVASLKWSGPGISKSIIPTQYLTTTDPGTGVDPTPDPDPDPQPDPDPHPTLENGFAGSYFANQTLTGVPLQQLDPVIHFDWGGGRPAILPSNDNFSIRWEGSIVIPAAGAYKLHTITDDGVRLFVNGNLVINDWKLHAPKQNTYSFTGQENQILNVVMEFFESGGGAVAKMEWEGPGISRGTVPAEQVFQNQASAEAYLNPPATSSYTSISQPGSSSSGSTTDQTTVATPGLYTLLLPLPDSLVDNGDGFGTLVVNNDLSGSLSLTMPDASSFTQDVQVTAEGIVINTTNGTGDQLTGTLIWRDLTGVSDLDGELTWTLQSLSNPITIVLIGSTYTEGTLESLLGSSAKLALAGSGVNQTLDVTISGNSVSATGEVNMGTFDPATGSFSWALNSFTVEGVFYEDQSLIGGYFHDGATQTGQMQIRPPSP